MGSIDRQDAIIQPVFSWLQVHEVVQEAIISLAANGFAECTHTLRENWWH